MSTARVLVVGDGAREAAALVTSLRKVGFDAEAVSDGSEALRYLERDRYAVVVSDLRMPGMDGPDFYRRVLRRWPNEPPRVLFVSDPVDVPPYVRFLELVRTPILLKPFSAAQLADVVRRALMAP
jgi:two-component system, cell cycle sensor histidine kinase and response regulator CckA